jgi:uncharacterized beta-barrel protein YwiB (DUF1934 family)
VIKITEVKIKIEAMIENLDTSGLPIGDTERTASEAEGFLRYSDGEVLLTYCEENEGGRADSEIYCKDGVVKVVRQGAIESEMIFEEGVLHSSIYSLPPYKFDAAITAKRVRCDVGCDGGKIDLLYNMKIGGAEKTTRMKIWISPSSNQI